MRGGCSGDRLRESKDNYISGSSLSGFIQEALNKEHLMKACGKCGQVKSLSKVRFIMEGTGEGAETELCAE